MEHKVFYILVTLVSLAFADQASQQQPQPSSVSSQPSQQTAATSLQDNVAQYVAGLAPYNPPSAYQYNEPNYGPVQPYENNYIVPYGMPPNAIQQPDDLDNSNPSSVMHYFTAVIPYAQMIYRLIAKVGVVFFGGALLLILGGLLTTAVCSFTPFCSIQFNGLGFNRETMRSLMTADNLSAASAFVQDAIEKYHKLNKV